MPKLARLLKEVVNMILTKLGDLDLKTLIVAHFVCTQFRELIETIVFRTRHQQPTASGEIEFDPFLRLEFSSLVHALEPKHCLKRLYEISSSSPGRRRKPRGNGSYALDPAGGASASPWAGAHHSPGARVVQGPPRWDGRVLQRGRHALPLAHHGLPLGVLLLGDLGLGADCERRGLRLGERVVDYRPTEPFRSDDGEVVSLRPYLAPVYGRDAASGQMVVLQVDAVAIGCRGGYESYVGFRDMWYPWPQCDDFLGFQPCYWQGPLSLEVPEEDDL